MSKDLATRNETAVEQPHPSDLLQVIANAVSNPAIDVEKMERLLAMHERIVERNAKVAFESALSRLQASLPQIDQSGVILAKDRITVKSRYAPLEDIDSIVRPLLAAEGFAVSYNTEELPSGKIRLTCKLSHKDGHSETRGLPLPIDKNEYRSAIQDHGSTISYGRRYLLKLHLNIIEKYEDNDGQANEPISEEQARDLEVMIQDAKADREKFLRFMDVEDIKDIWVKDLPKAVNALESKKRKK